MSFEQIYLQYYSKMKRFAQEYVSTEADAENILQDVFADFWEKREIMLTHINVIAFLFTAIRNRCIDYLRRKTKEQEAMEYLQEEYNLTVKINLDSLVALDAGLFYREDIEKTVNRAIEALPDKCRRIFIMNKFKGKKQKDIADELNISVNTVETQMGIAYRKLKESLKDCYPLFFFLFIPAPPILFN
jgi:RNA polymerase sigma-70 factor (ECF subfamily)